MLLQRLFYYAASLTSNGTVDLEAMLNEQLSKLKDIPDFLGAVVVTDINLGEVLPLITQLQITQWTQSQPVEFDFSVTYLGDAHICLATELQLNYPAIGFASLPIEIAVLDLRFDLHIHCVISEGKISVSLLEKPVVAFELSSEIGYANTLKDPPHLKVAINTMLDELLSKLIYPKQYTITLFSTPSSSSSSSSSSVASTGRETPIPHSQPNPVQPVVNLNVNAPSRNPSQNPSRVPSRVNSPIPPLHQHHRSSSGSLATTSSWASSQPQDSQNPQNSAQNLREYYRELNQQQQQQQQHYNNHHKHNHKNHSKNHYYKSTQGSISTTSLASLQTNINARGARGGGGGGNGGIGVFSRRHSQPHYGYNPNNPNVSPTRSRTAMPRYVDIDRYVYIIYQYTGGDSTAYFTFHISLLIS